MPVSALRHPQLDLSAGSGSCDPALEQPSLLRPPTRRLAEGREESMLAANALVTGRLDGQRGVAGTPHLRPRHSDRSGPRRRARTPRPPAPFAGGSRHGVLGPSLWPRTESTCGAGCQDSKAHRSAGSGLRRRSAAFPPNNGCSALSAGVKDEGRAGPSSRARSSAPRDPAPWPARAWSCADERVSWAGRARYRPAAGEATAPTWVPRTRLKDQLPPATPRPQVANMHGPRPVHH